MVCSGHVGVQTVGGGEVENTLGGIGQGSKKKMGPRD